MSRYYIEESFIEELEKKLNRIARKCQRNGNEFHYERVGEEMRKAESKPGQFFGASREERMHRFIIIEVEGCAKVNGYELVAVLDMHSEGNVIRRVNTEIELPERFRNSPNVCEHCNSTRNRDQLFVVYNSETGEFKQVGRNCLALYTNGLNAEYAAAYLDGIEELEKCEERSELGLGGHGCYIKIEDVLAYAVEIINKMGYFNANSDVSTRSLVVDMLAEISFSSRVENVNNKLRRAHFAVRFEDSDFLKPETAETVQKIIAYYKDVEDNSEFVHNIKTILADGYVSAKDLGFTCYMPSGYNKYCKVLVERAKREKVNANSNYYGDVNTRYKDVEVAQMEQIAAYDSMYGELRIYRIVLKNGAVLVWKTSTFMSELQMTNVKLATFTVKAHNEYRGAKQTEITRAKFA